MWESESGWFRIRFGTLGLFAFGISMGCSHAFLCKQVFDFLLLSAGTECGWKKSNQSKKG